MSKNINFKPKAEDQAVINLLEGRYPNKSDMVRTALMLLAYATIDRQTVDRAIIEAVRTEEIPRIAAAVKVEEFGPSGRPPGPAIGEIHPGHQSHQPGPR